MLVAVVSDSHNNSEAVDLAKKAISKCDVLLFLGERKNYAFERILLLSGCQQ